MTEGRDARPGPRAQRHLLLADLDGTLYQLFSVTFTRDGIFVSFPYHPDAPVRCVVRRLSLLAPSRSTWTP